jgi:hypothetical protein
MKTMIRNKFSFSFFNEESAFYFDIHQLSEHATEMIFKIENVDEKVFFDATLTEEEAIALRDFLNHALPITK